MPLMNGGQAVVRALRAEGVEVVFGLPGVQIMHIVDGFFDAPDIRLITARHEQTAAFMADGYARTTGKPGVALVVPGPGAYNAGAGMATAYAASSPVFLIAGQIASAAIGKDLGALHDVHDQLEFLKPVTKWNARVLAAEDIPGAVHEAMRQMATGRPRPVEIEVPPDVLGASSQIDLIEPELHPPPQPDKELIDQAADLLASAVRPLIWSGGGVNQAGAWDELRQMAELLEAPVMTTPEGKGGFSEAHPLSVGCTNYRWGAAVDVVPQADVILAVGTRLSFPTGADWVPGPHQKLVNLNIDPSEFGKTFPASVGIPADARGGLSSLAQALRERTRGSTWDTAELATLRVRARDQIKAAAPRQLALVDALRSGIPEDGIVVTDVTIMAAWCAVAFPMTRPRSYITSSYMGTLGYAFPTALGAKVGNPDKPVIALCGDGGFMYAVSELATAVQYGINVVAVVVNNNAFGASNWDQQTRFEGRVVGTELHNPNFVQLAQSFGARGIRVEETEALPAAIEEAIAGQCPAVVEIVVPILDPPYQMVPPRRT